MSPQVTVLADKVGLRDRTWLLRALIIATSAGFVAVIRGVAETFGVFILPLEQSLALNRAETTAIYALAMLAIGLCGPLTGALVDRFGPRTAYTLAAATALVALASASVATMLWQLQLALGLGLGLAVACVGPATQGSMISRWFRGRESTIFGIISGTAGLAALVFTPLSQLLIEEWGWRGAYQTLALLVSLLLIPLAVLPWRSINAGPQEASPANQRVAEAPVAWRRILRETLLWRVLASHFLTCFAMLGVQVLIVVYLIDSGYAPLTAASGVGLAGLATACGMVLFGWMSDRVGWRRTLTFSFACSAAGMLALWAMSWGATPWLLVLYVMTFGLTLGSRGPLMAGLVMRRFAMPATGRILGMALLAFGTGSAAGAWCAGILHETTDGYGAGLTLSAVSLSLALMLWWIGPDPTRPGQPLLPR